MLGIFKRVQAVLFISSDRLDINENGQSEYFLDPPAHLFNPVGLDVTSYLESTVVSVSVKCSCILFEMIHNRVTLQRREKDNFVNATRMLAAAVILKRINARGAAIENIKFMK